MLAVCSVLLGLALPSHCWADETKLDPAKVEFFENKIRPILVQHCYECHASSTGENSGNLRLDLAASLRKGGDHGPAISLESPAESILLKAVSYEQADMQMPPSGKLSQQALDDLRVWIEQGAVDPRLEAANGKSPPRDRFADAANHWAFRPLAVESTSPNSNFTQRSPIDQLLDSKLAERGIVPNSAATPREQIRRIYYDLTGLPPTWDQYSSLEQQPLERYEAWVDSLIASPQFGERMARHWMDVSRYADTKGYVFQEDREYANGWKYRDWIINSFNNDLPYDQFVSLQISADRMDPGPENTNLNAMGFLTLGRRFLNNENDIADDRIDVISRGLLGLSVTCARCHEHKFDAIEMADYYSMHAALVSCKEPKDEPGPLRLVDAETIRPAVIYKRGNPGMRGDTVPKLFVKFLSTVSRPMETGSGRLELAQAIADRKNPLTARVFVNRVWGWLMGAPLVHTPSDFGVLCPTPPQHALLDHMAAEFIADSWSVKRLVKRIVMSDAYRRSSAQNEQSFAADPENLLWWRGNRKRLDFESLRDSVLVGCRLLDSTVGGPSIKMIDAPFSNRRTLYAYIDRQNLPGVFRSFDFASPDTHVPNRLSTTVPQQGLFMMNSPMIDHYATERSNKLLESASLPETVSEELRAQKSNDLINELFHATLLRAPSDAQREKCLAYLQMGLEPNTDIRKWRWTDLTKALLCTNEFCFID